jgi:hypothetical protein
MITENILANAGTPLMWAMGLHLIIGNLLIGIGEGLLVGLIFRVNIGLAICLMIPANYFSAGSGYLILNTILPHLNQTMTIYTIQHILWMAYGFAFIYTIIAEWPFLFFLMRHKKRKIIISIVATILIQTISYTVLAYWYGGASYNTLSDSAEIVHSLDFINNKKATVYFIGQDKNIYQIGIDGLHAEKIYEPVKKQDLMKLHLKINSESKNADLCVSLLKDFYTDREDITYTAKKDILSQRQMKTISLHEHETDMSWEATDFRPQDQRQWYIRAGFWAAEGLYFWNNQTQERLWISLETPFVQWYVRSATALPEDEVVFQFGNQICVYSRQTHKLALLTMGTSPVVILTAQTPEGS